MNVTVLIIVAFLAGFVLKSFFVHHSQNRTRLEVPTGVPPHQTIQTIPPKLIQAGAQFQKFTAKFADSENGQKQNTWVFRALRLMGFPVMTATNRALWMVWIGKRASRIWQILQVKYP